MEDYDLLNTYRIELKTYRAESIVMLQRVVDLEAQLSRVRDDNIKLKEKNASLVFKLDDLTKAS